MIKKKIWL